MVSKPKSDFFFKIYLDLLIFFFFVWAVVIKLKMHKFIRIIDEELLLLITVALENFIFQ